MDLLKRWRVSKPSVGNSDDENEDTPPRRRNSSRPPSPRSKSRNGARSENTSRRNSNSHKKPRSSAPPSDDDEEPRRRDHKRDRDRDRDRDSDKDSFKDKDRDSYRDKEKPRSTTKNLDKPAPPSTKLSRSRSGEKDRDNKSNGDKKKKRVDDDDEEDEEERQREREEKEVAKHRSRLREQANKKRNGDDSPSTSRSGDDSPKVNEYGFETESRIIDKSLMFRDEKLYAKHEACWAKWKQKNEVPDEDIVDGTANFHFRQNCLKSKDLIRNGILPPDRRNFWELLSGARTLPDRLQNLHHYAYLCRQAEKAPNKHIPILKKDVNNAIDDSKLKEGVKSVLCAFTVRSPNVGYCPSMIHVVHFLLKMYDEERTFWMLCAFVDILLPPDYYSTSLLGSRTDLAVLRRVVFERLRKVHNHMTSNGVDPATMCLKWLMSLYIQTLPHELICRIWDIMLLEGSHILISTAVALFELHQKYILTLKDQELVSFLNRLGKEYYDADTLCRTLFSKICLIDRTDYEQMRRSERVVLEAKYMKTLQEDRARKIVEEEARLAAEAEEKKRVAEAMEYLEKGVEMLKLPRQGEPKKTKVTLVEGDDGKLRITWASKRKKDDEASILLSASTLVTGNKSGIFVIRPKFMLEYDDQADRAFSLLAPHRSLDLIAESKYDYDKFIYILKRHVAIFRDAKEMEKKRLAKAKELEAAKKLQDERDKREAESKAKEKELEKTKRATATSKNTGRDSGRDTGRDRRPQRDESDSDDDFGDYDSR